MPINFTCPNCGKQTVVADQFAGQTGPCTACGANVTIPLAAPGGFPPGPTHKSSSGGASVLLIVLAALAVVGFVCAGVAFLLLMPAVSAARGAARRAQSTNNMRQLGLALHNYHDTFQTFPPAVVTDADGKPLYSGRVLLLPYMEQAALYQQFDKNKAWNSPENQAVTSAMIKVFQDPADPNNSNCDYVFVTGTGTVFEGSKPARMADITDGTSLTIVMVQTANGPSNWAEPTDWNADTPVPKGSHPNAVLVLFADGSVRSINPQQMQNVAKQLTQRSDGQAVPDLGY
jgi:hypothetical protein